MDHPPKKPDSAHEPHPPVQKWNAPGLERFLNVSVLTAAAIFLLSADRVLATLTYSVIIIALIAAIVAVVWFFLNY